MLEALIEAVKRHDPTRTLTLTTGALLDILVEAQRIQVEQEEARILIEDQALDSCYDNYGSADD